MTEERIQKLLAQAGYGSRRACEEFLTEHRVTVNGKWSSSARRPIRSAT